MTKFIHQQIKERREMIRAGALDGSDPSNGRDAFTMLVKANEDEGTKLSLSDNELVNGLFCLMIPDRLILFLIGWKCLCPSVYWTRYWLFAHSCGT